MSLQTGVLNFALFMKLPSLHLPSLFLAVTAFAAGVGHASRPRRAPGQTTSPVLGFARNRSPWHPPALATRPATLCSPRRRGWPATRRSTRAPRPRPTQHLLGLLASPSHSPPLPRHDNLLLFLSTCAFKFTGVAWNLSCMILGTYA